MQFYFYGKLFPRPLKRYRTSFLIMTFFVSNEQSASCCCTSQIRPLSFSPLHNEPCKKGPEHYHLMSGFARAWPTGLLTSRLFSPDLYTYIFIFLTHSFTTHSLASNFHILLHPLAAPKAHRYLAEMLLFHGILFRWFQTTPCGKKKNTELCCWAPRSSSYNSCQLGTWMTALTEWNLFFFFFNSSNIFLIDWKSMKWNGIEHTTSTEKGRRNTEWRRIRKIQYYHIGLELELQI